MGFPSRSLGAYFLSFILVIPWKITPSSTIRLGLVTVPSKRAGRLISTLEDALTVPFTEPEIMTMFAFISALITAPSEIMSVSFEKILPFT